MQSSRSFSQIFVQSLFMHIFKRSRRKTVVTWHAESYDGCYTIIKRAMKNDEEKESAT